MWHITDLCLSAGQEHPAYVKWVYFSGILSLRLLSSCKIMRYTVYDSNNLKKIYSTDPLFSLLRPFLKGNVNLKSPGSQQ